jgi:hypothetical protein
MADDPLKSRYAHLFAGMSDRDLAIYEAAALRDYTVWKNSLSQVGYDRSKPQEEIMAEKLNEAQREKLNEGLGDQGKDKFQDAVELMRAGINRADQTDGQAKVAEAYYERGQQRDKGAEEGRGVAGAYTAATKGPDSTPVKADDWIEKRATANHKPSPNQSKGENSQNSHDNDGRDR